MKNKSKSFRKLISFIQGKETFALYTGNNSFDEHSVALAALMVCFFGDRRNILFRTSSVKVIEKYLSRALAGLWDGDPGNSKFRRQVKKAVKDRNFSISSMNIFIDTINPRSHIITPDKIHAAILYPAEEFLPNCILEKTLEDLYQRKTEKIIFCSLGNEDLNLKELDLLKPVMVEGRDFSPKKHITAEEKLENICYACC